MHLVILYGKTGRLKDNNSYHKVFLILTFLMRDSYAIINLKNLEFNYLNLRKKVSPAKFLAVVKADAYGHGAIEVSKFLSNLIDKPEYYGVALFQEAIELRNFNIKEPILVFNVIDLESIKIAIEYNLTFTISHLNDYLIIREYLRKNDYNVILNAHIKINTGMNRLGIRWDTKLFELEKFFKLKNLNISGIYTHFATSDIPGNKFAQLQLKRFNDLLDKLFKRKIEIGLIHSANSGAILNMPDSYFDMVRAGISLYGYKPDLMSLDSVKLKPVMSIISKVASVNKVRSGESVSYGQKYFTKKNTKIASVTFGYADGYSRNLSNKAFAIIKNKSYPQVGTVTMDRVMFDIGNSRIYLGEEVILMGQKNKLKFDAWDWSLILNTIPYEVTCNISKRVPRVYIRK